MKKTLNVFVNAYWTMSGGDKRVIEILKEWSKNDEFDIVIYAPEIFIQKLNENNITKFQRKITSNNKIETLNIYGEYIFRTIKAIFMLPFNVDNQIFYSISDFFPDVIPCMLGKMINKNSIWVALIHHIIENYKTRPGKKIRNFFAYYSQKISMCIIKKFSNQIFVVSPLVKKKLEEKNCLEKISLINNGVDIDCISSILPFNEKENAYEAIMLARMVYSKGIYDIPLIWEKVVEKMPDARIALIGDGSQENIKKFKKLCIEKGLERNIKILGYQTDENVYAYLKSSKVFLFTSREEGWGISIAEAMACGLPVVAFDLPVYKHIFKNNLILIPNRNVELAADMVVNLLESQIKMKELGDNAQKFVFENYGWQKVALDELEKLQVLIK